MGLHGHDPEATIASQHGTPTGDGRGPWLRIGLGVVAFVIFLCVAAAVASYFFIYKDRIQIAHGTPPAAEQPPGSPSPEATETPQEPTATPTWTETPPPTTKEPTATPTLSVTPLPGATPGGEVTGPPTIGPITFTNSIGESGEPEGSFSEFPPFTNEIYAFFDYSGIPDGATFERAWYLDGEETARGSTAWDEGQSGQTYLRLYASSGVLTPGGYRLELYIDGTLLQTGTFTIEWPAAAPGEPSVLPIRVVYAAWDGMRYQLHAMNLDGSDDIVVFGPADSPSWDPGGTMVSIFGEEGLRFGTGLYIVAADGSMLGRKYTSDPNIRYTQWSPDGTRVAYDSQRGGGSRQIFVCDLSQEADTCESWGPQGEFPAWNPQSDKIVYRNCDEGRCSLGIINISGSSWDHGSKTRIPNTGDDFFPAWSPDGSQVAFTRKLSEDNYDVFVVGVDGSDLKQLTDDPALDVLPAWTPDGRILFRSARGGGWGIYIMNRDGSGQEKIKDVPAGPDWGRAGLTAMTVGGW
jgi:hypothetical protein